MKLRKLKNWAIGLLFISTITPFAEAQTFDWAKGIGSTSNDVATDVVADGNGNSYTVGNFYGTVDFDPGAGVTNLTSGGGRDIFITKFDATGTLTWAVRFGGVGDDIGNGIAIDATGNVHITGGFFGTVDFDPGPGTSTLGNGTGMDIFVLKLTTDASFVWVKQFGGNNDNQMGNKIAVDAAGNVYSTGQCIGVIDYDPGPGTANLGVTPSTNTNFYVSKLDINGNYVWAKVMGNSSNGVYGLDIAVSANQEVFTCGYFFGAVDFDPGAGSFAPTSSGGDAFVHKFDASGVFVWAKTFGNTSIGNEAALSIVLSNNRVYTTGYFTNNCDLDPNAGTVNFSSIGAADIFVQVLDYNGNYQWARQLGGGAEDWGYGISIDAAGSVYTTGFFTGNTDFNPGAGNAPLSAVGTRDAFISKLDLNGNYLWALQMGGLGIDTGYGIHVNSQGAVYTAGSYAASGDFDPTAGTTTLTNAGSNDIFIQKMAAQCLTPYAPANTTAPNSPIICYNSSTTLSASGIGTLGWYSASTGGTYLGGGSNYTTPNITANTSFYVQDSLCAAGPRTEIQVSIGTTVTDQTLTAAQSSICQGNSTTITINGSDPGVNYYLRNDSDNSIVQGPIAGNGSPIVFNTGNLNTTTTFNVSGATQLGSNNIGVDLDGVNDYVSLGVDGRGITTTVTVSARVKASATGASQFIVYKYNSTNGFLLYIDATGKARFDGRDGSGSYRSTGPSTTTVTDGQWHDITGVVRSTGWEIYVDGVLQNSFACPPAVSLFCTANCFVGTNNTAYSSMDIDRVALWNTALSAGTILSNATSCLNGGETNIKGLFTFSEGSGTVVNDDSPTNIDGVLTNMTAPACWIPVTTDYCAAICQTEMSQLVTITVTSIPSTPTISAGGPTIFCQGGSVTLTSSSPTNNVWSTGETTPSIVVTAAGTYTVAVGTAGCQSPTSPGTTISVNSLPAQPSISAGGPTTFCSGGSVTLTSTAGTSYLWSNGATTASINATASGTYTVQVTNAAGCQSIASNGTTVAVNALPAQPSITAGGPTTFCQGGSVVLNSSAGTSYLWSDGSMSSSINPSLSGTYTVQVTNASGCQSVPSAPVTITVNALPNPPIISPNGPTTFCSGGTVNLASSAGITYLWSNGSTSPSIDVTTSGTFTVQITGPNGCQSPSSAPTTVTVNTSPTIYLGTVSNPTSCTNANGSIEVTGSGAGDLSWTGSSSGTMGGVMLSTMINGLNNGSYTITFTNTTGCVSNTLNASLTAPAAPAAPSITAAGSTTFCAGGSVVLTSSNGISYLWSTGETSPSITVSNAGNYTVSITDASGCTSPASTAIAVTVNALPVINIGTTSNPSSCTIADGSIEILGSGNGDINWSGTSSGSATGISLPYTITGLANGSYNVTFTNGNGCTSTVATGTLTSPSAPPAPSITPNGSTTFCEGDMVTLTSSTGNSYLWSNGETTASIDVSTSGTYSVIITDASGCTSPSSTNTVVVVNEIPVATTTLSGITLTANPSGANYQWIDCTTNDGISGANSLNFTPTVNGTYAVVVTVNGCSDTSDCVVINSVGIEEINVSEIKLYPNPSSDLVTISSNEEILQIELYSQVGALIRTIEKETFNVSDLSTGVYFVNVKTLNGTSSIRFVKQ